MTVLGDLMPTAHPTIMELVSAAGVNVSGWSKFRGAPSKNPKYCYEWAFLEPGKLVVVTLWHQELKSRAGRIEADMRPSQYRPKQAIRKTRSSRVSEKIIAAFDQGLPVRVIVLARDPAKPNSLGVKGRMLDPMPWSITDLDRVTGDCTLVRGDSPGKGSGTGVDVPIVPLRIADLLIHKGTRQIRTYRSRKPPYPRELKQKRPTDKPRQLEFESALRAISAVLGSRTIPVAFRDSSGDRFILDTGCIGHAVANKFLELPRNGEDVRYVNLRADPQGAQRPRKYSRICWNTAHWRQPTGEAQRLEKDTYAANRGFGHEEWLFNFAWQLKAPGEGNTLFRYGYLQPIAKGRSSLKGKALDLRIYAIAPDKRRLAVADIVNAYVPENDELQGAYKEMRRRGWLQEMKTHLKGLGISTEPLRQAAPWEVANIRFRQQDVHFFDPMMLLTATNAPGMGWRYQLDTWAGEPQLGRGARPVAKSERRLKGEADGGRRAIEAGVVRYTHNRIQNALLTLLRRQYGKGAVDYESDNVDITLRLKDSVILIEVKTANTPRQCVREALGQLLEYAHYPDLDRECGLIVVGPQPPDSSLDTYLAQLKARYNLPITYRHWIEVEDKLATPIA